MTYEYTLYNSKRNRKIDAILNECCFVWNHALALQRRYYKIFNKYISCARMKSHFARRIKRNLLHSQTTQEILERLDASYRLFFKKVSKRPPKFRKQGQFRSFVYKQGGYKLNSNVIVLNSIKQHFQFSFSRKWIGNIKNIRIKKSSSGKFTLYIITDAVASSYRKTHNGASIGMDFGLKHFLTLSDGTIIDYPYFLKQHLKKLRILSKKASNCTIGSMHHASLLRTISLLYNRICNLRKDWHWKLSHLLCKKYDVICIEDLNMRGMCKMWGSKIFDSAWYSFIQKLNHVASKYGVSVIKIPKYFPSSKTCSSCHHVNELLRFEREWVCPMCGKTHNRDINAAINILRQGIVSSESICKTKVCLC